MCCCAKSSKKRPCWRLPRRTWGTREAGRGRRQPGLGQASCCRLPSDKAARAMPCSEAAGRLLSGLQTSLLAAVSQATSAMPCKGSRQVAENALSSGQPSVRATVSPTVLPVPMPCFVDVADVGGCRHASFGTLFVCKQVCTGHLLLSCRHPTGSGLASALPGCSVPKLSIHVGPLQPSSSIFLQL